MPTNDTNEIDQKFFKDMYQKITSKQELYVTEVEQETYDLTGQLALNQVRCHIDPRKDKAGKPFYVVVVDAPEAMDRARKVRKSMFGS